MLRNHNKEAATVRVVEHLHRWTNWVITRESARISQHDLHSSLHLVMELPGPQARYTSGMDRVEEIEAAIDGLPAEEFRRIVQWFHEREQRHWDEQMDADSSSGKLDFLFEEAENESRCGLLSEWPPSK